jgi:hypothetical protein
MKRSLFVFLLLSLIFANQTFASDTTYRKKPLYISVIAGYTSNRMFGTMMDHYNGFNYQFNIKNARQENGDGWALGVNLQKQISKVIYFKTGLTYMQKQVNPLENSFMKYKDSLKTGYLSIPALVGFTDALNKNKTIFLSLELGLSGDFRLIDHSHAAIDVAGFETNFATLSLQTGCGLTFRMPSGGCLDLHYSYLVNMTEAYKETLYWGGNPIYRDFSYKYQTQFFSLGLRWPI